MTSDELKTLERHVRSFNDHLRGLTPEQRRKVVTNLVQARVKTGRRSLATLTIVAIVSFLGALQLWLGSYQMSLASTLGGVSGVILAGLGIKTLIGYKVETFTKIASGDISDDDALAWFEEEEAVNQRFMSQWQTHGRYLVLAAVSALALLFAIPSTAAFAMMVLASGFTLFLCVLLLFPVTKSRWLARLRPRPE